MNSSCTKALQVSLASSTRGKYLGLLQFDLPYTYFYSRKISSIPFIYLHVAYHADIGICINHL